MAEEGNDDVGGDAVFPEGRGSVGRKRGSRRSSQAQRGVEGETVAVALRWRGCGCARRVRERGSRGEIQGRGRERGGPGGRGGAEEMTRGVAVARRRRQAAWWRGELGRVRRVHPLPTGTRRKATGRRRWAGLLEELGQVSGPGGLPLSLSFLVSVFYFFNWF